MLKLIKYEFRKNRNVLLVITGGLLLLQLYFMFRVFTYNGEGIALEISAVLLSIYSSVCFFVVFILSVSNYSRELNSKSSYLIFMTPNSSYGIIFSKMLSTLLLGMIMGAVITLLTFLDFWLYHTAVPTFEDLYTSLRFFLETMGIPVGEILLSALSALLTGLIEFFTIVAVAYLAITLSSTFLQNSKLKYVLSAALFLVIFYVFVKITSLLPELYRAPATPLETIVSILPATIFALAVMVLCIFVSGVLLEKKVSL